MATCKDLRRQAAHAVKVAKAAEKAVYAANAAVAAAVKQQRDPHWVTTPEAQRAREAVKPLIVDAQRASDRFFVAASEASNLRDAVAARCTGRPRARKAG